jgi:hypothetical protein
MNRRILIGSPARNGFKGPLMTRLLDLLCSSEKLGVELSFMAAEDASVAMARNELAYQAVSGGFDALVQMDGDLRWTELDFRRLISHDWPIVAGIYCKKLPGDPYWLFKPWSGADPSANLLRCSAMAIGFSYITTGALRQIQEKTPELAFHQAWPASERAALRHEWFPTGVVDRHFVQEDYGFARLATRAGLPLFVDRSIVLPHTGDADFPEADEAANMKLPPSDEFYERS